MDKEYKYMVATRCFTYNHAPYIEDALRGFAMQETTFPVVYIVVDDASTDGEPEVLRKWVAENMEFEDGAEVWKDMPYGQLSVANLKGNPLSTFVVLLLNENHYSINKPKMPYFAEWNENAKYVALCEGDDYWTDSLKLQKQVDFLEKNPDYSISHTGFVFFYQRDGYFEESNASADRIAAIEKNTYDIIPYILKGDAYRIQTCSVIYRKSDYDKISRHVEKMRGMFLMGDTQLWCLLCSVAKIHYHKDFTCVYRISEGSACRPNDAEKMRRFRVSCAEMRVFMSEFLQLNSPDKELFKKQLVESLIHYYPYNKNYVPVVELRLTRIEKMKFAFAKSQFGGSFIKYIDFFKRSQPVTVLTRTLKKFSSIFL